MMDAKKEIRRAVDTGKIVFGSKQSLVHALNGKGKMVIVSKNTELEVREDIENACTISNVPLYKFEGTGLELGEVCGKPFTISAMTVLDEGKSKVTDLLKEQPAEEKKAKTAEKTEAKKAGKKPAVKSKKTVEKKTAKKEKAKSPKKSK